MCAQKQPVNFSFGQGLETKTDPYQLPLGKFLVLENSVFTVGKRLTKRNGYGALASLPYAASFTTTFNGDLTAFGTSIEAYSTGNRSWVNKGSIQPLTLSVLPLVRNNLNQTQADSAVAPNGYACTAYTESVGTSVSYKYVIADSVTGQNIVAPTTLASDATYGTPRVFVLGSYFIIVYTTKVVSNYHLAFIAISTSNPSVVSSQADVSTSFTPSSTLAFDGVVFSGNLYLAWNGASASGIKMATISSTLAVSATVIRDAAHVATIVSVTADAGNSIIWVSYYDSGGSTGYSLATDPSLILQANFPTQIISSGTILNLATAAQSGVATVFYETSHTDNGIQTNFVSSETVTQSTGVVGSPSVTLRSVGLASKAFIIDSVIYFLAAHSSPFQPTYFLVNGSSTSASPRVIAKIAYENGGGYITTGLPSVTVTDSTASIAYLFKDLIEPVSNANASGTAVVGGVYSQTGINLVSFTLGQQGIVTAEIGSNLNITGGFLQAYDGYLPVEQNFHLWPDSVQVSTNASAVTPTGTVTTGSNIITAVSSMAGVGIGASVSGTGIPSNQVVTGFTSNTITFGPLVSTGTHVAEAITVTGNIAAAQDYYYEAIYSWTDNQGNPFRSAGSIPVKQTTTGTTSTNAVIVPTLRITAKVANPVKIELYRWSTAQQTYYQVTSISQPTLNSTTTDSVTIYDCLSDASILGNSILYTTGGVLENTGAPASSAMTLFDDRPWLIDSEDQNLLWYGKQVIAGTPVEMSDLLTMYVAPSIGATGPTGPMRCLSAMDDKLIIFKQNAMNYVNGTGPDSTGANNQYSQPTFITSMVGCSNQRSIVFQPEGLMFEFSSESGNQIWLLGRDLSTKYIGAPVEAFTTDATVLSSLAVPGTNQVRFNLSSGITLMFDYYYGQWGVFNTSAISSTLFQGLHTYIDKFGRVFQETPGLYLDGTTPVLISFVTGWLNAAGIRGYERIYEYSFLGTYYSPHRLVIQTAYDYGMAEHQATYSPPNFAPAYGSQPGVYGSGSPYGGASNIEQFRVFAKRQKCKAFQIRVQEVYDPSLGVAAGEGLSLSGINLVVGLKKGWAPVPAKNSVG